METEIKRINHFDGLFLKQGEFQAEQLYHQHMRRRVHYVLFDGSGVVQANTGDLRITPTAPPLDKTFHVTAGMAISHRDDLAEGREIVLRTDSQVFDLGALGFAQAFVAIHYEELLQDPQVGGTPPTETRVAENAVVTVHDVAAGWPPAAPLPDGEQYVLLGQIQLSDMAVDETQRQTSFLRAGLISGGGGAPKTLVSIAVSPAAPSIPEGSTQTFTAAGTFDDASVETLTNAVHGLTWATSNNGLLPIDAVTGVATGTAQGGPITITATVGPITGTATAQVVAAGNAPIIDSLSPDTQASGGVIDIRGENLHDPLLNNNDPAPTTTVTLSALGQTEIATNVTVRPPGGFAQRVRVTIPPRNAAWGTSELVTLELTFNGSDTISFTYDD